MTAGEDSASRGLRVAGWGSAPPAGVHAALLLTSMALLVLEVSLTRFFSHTIWYHFAYLTISVALLGFGSAGSIVAAFPGLFERRGASFLRGALVAAAVLTIAGHVFLAQFPLEVENLLNKPAKFSLSLLAYYVVVGAPFVLAGFSISVPFSAWPGRMGRLYFWDLLGAALGCAFVVSLIEPLGVPGLVFSAAGLLLLAAAALAEGAAVWRFAALAVLVVALAGPAGRRLPVHVTSSKSLPSQAELAEREGGPLAGRTDVFTKWTAINRVDAFGWDHPSPHTMWSALGLKQRWTGDLPPAARLMYDGGNGSDIFGSRGDLATEFRFLEHHLLRTPYVLLERPKVLVIGVGGGIDVYNAVVQGARHVTGAELQPETVKLLEGPLTGFTGGFWHRDDVRLVASEGRHFVRKTDETFDLVQISFVDTFAAQAAGAYVLAESYLYTVDAMEDYLARLAPDGLVTTVMGEITFEGHAPPLTTRLALNGLRALQRLGVAEPRRHIAVVGSVTEGTFAENASVMVKKSPFTEGEIARLRAFAADSGFRMLYAPGDDTTPLAKLIAVDEPARLTAIDAELFHVEACTDDDPFFYNVGKWRNFSPESSILFTMPGSFMGQLVLVMMVAQSTLLGAALVIGPLLVGARGTLGGRGVVSYLAYFLALGVGFMFLEISFVQSFVLFLGSPTYALSVTIFALLLFSGIGSLASSRWASRPERALRVLAPSLAAIAAAYAFGLAHVFDAALHLDLGLRIAIAVAAQMPIGLVLGMFLPLGVAVISREHPRLVPWAWGVNGVGSVSGTTLAVLLAMAVGFRAVALVAAGLYIAGTALLLRASRRES